jgi:NADH-quinone oxidoreductase subunit A
MSRRSETGAGFLWLAGAVCGHALDPGRVLPDPRLHRHRCRHRSRAGRRLADPRPPAPDPVKLSAYECGFEPFDDARRKFDVRFYLVAILFIIFDLEVAFLFPWAVTLGDTGWFGFASMMLFLAMLTIGFIYEWKKGALEWE